MKKYSSILVFNRPNLGEQGFTLLEILIAIVLLAFITIGIVDITENASQTKERTTEANQNNLQIETAMGRFDWDFSQIYSPLYFSTRMNFQSNNPLELGGGTTTGEPSIPGIGNKTNPYTQQYYEQLASRFERNEHFSSVSKEGLPIPRFYNPEKNIFEFFTSSNRRKVENQKQSHFAWVRYALAEQEDLPDDEENEKIPKSLKSFVRYFSSDDPYSDKRINIEDTDRIKGAVLLRNVENLEFHFWDYQRKKWQTSLKSIPGGEGIVSGVKIIITWYDSTGHKRTSSRIFRNHWPMVGPQDQPATTAPLSNQDSGTINPIVEEDE